MKTNNSGIMARISAFGLYLISIVCAYSFEKGETAVVVKDTTARFKDTPANQVSAGKQIVVFEHNKETGKVFFLGLDSAGRQVAFNIDAIALVSKDRWASLEEKARQQEIQGNWKVEFYKSEGRESSFFYVFDSVYGKTYVYAHDQSMKKRINEFIALGIMKGDTILGRDRVKVTGVFYRDRWGREDRSHGFIASSIENADQPKQITLVDVLINPADYLDKTVLMEGVFRVNNIERRSFDMNQGDKRVEVFYERYIPRENWRSILNQKNFSDAKVSATGILRKFKDEDHVYYLEAGSVTIAGTNGP